MIEFEAIRAQSQHRWTRAFARAYATETVINQLSPRRAFANAMKNPMLRDCDKPARPPWG